jgi:hypothetical protein
MHWVVVLVWIYCFGGWVRLRGVGRPPVFDDGSVDLRSDGASDPQFEAAAGGYPAIAQNFT